MKLTLLDMVQDILNDMDSDLVNSITDTAESQQVAQIVKTTYYEMISRREFPHTKQFSQLDSLSDATRPNYLKVPERVGKVEFIMYNRRKINETKNRWKNMVYLYPDEFAMKIANRNSDDANIIQVTDFDGAVMNIRTNEAPTFYTSFDDEYVVFDSYDVAVEDTLTGTQSQVHFIKIPTWTHEDNFIPFLKDELFPGFLAEAKSVATLKLKEEEDGKAEQQSVRQQRRMSLDGWTVNKGMRYPNYGRARPRAAHRNRPRIFGERV